MRIKEVLLTTSIKYQVYRLKIFYNFLQKCLEYYYGKFKVYHNIRVTHKFMFKSIYK